VSFHSLSAFLLSVPLAAPQETAPAPAVSVRTIAATSSPVKRFALDEKQTRIALLTVDEQISLVQRANDKPVWSHANENPSIDIAIGGEFVIAGMTIASYSAFELESGRPVTAVGAPDVFAASTCVAVDPKGRWVWLGSEKDALQRVTAADAWAWSRRGLSHGGSTAMALSADGDLLAVAGADRTLRFVNSKSAQVDDKKVFEGLESPALTLAFDSKSALLASTGEDKVVRIWAVASGKTKAKLVGHEGIVRALAFDPKGRLAAGDEKGVVKIWSVDKGEVLFELPNAGGGAVTDLEFVDKGKALLGACGVNGLLLWDLSKL
jgi:hypothetical protein